MATPQRSPTWTMRCATCGVTLLLEDLATIMSKVRTENSLRVVGGGQGARPETTSGGRLPEGMKVLDVGSGAGNVALLAADLVGLTGSVLGVDQNPEILQTATARAEASGLNMPRSAGDQTFPATTLAPSPCGACCPSSSNSVSPRLMRWI